MVQKVPKGRAWLGRGDLIGRSENSTETWLERTSTTQRLYGGLAVRVSGF